jgi:hypothetical protein
LPKNTERKWQKNVCKQKKAIIRHFQTQTGQKFEGPKVKNSLCWFAKRE